MLIMTFNHIHDVLATFANTEDPFLFAWPFVFLAVGGSPVLMHNILDICHVHAVVYVF